MHITVALCTWNRSELLRRTLQSIERIDPPREATWRLLVVNNNSTDATEDVLREFQSRLPLDVVCERTAGASHARNRAVREARGDYLLWTDDDVQVDQKWLAAFADCARRHPEAGAFGGPIAPWFPVQPDDTFMESFPYLASGFCGLDHGLNEGDLPTGLYVWGANLGLKLSALSANPYDVSLGPSPFTNGGGGEELKLIRELRSNGFSVVWSPEMRVRHYVEPRRMTLDYLLGYSETKGRESVLFAKPDASPRLLDAPRWFWREMTRATAAYALSRMGVVLPGPAVSKSGPAPRVGAPAAVRRLAWQREYMFLRGMRRGYREIATRSHEARSEAAAGR